MGKALAVQMFPLALKASKEGGPDLGVNRLVGISKAHCLHKAVFRYGKLEMPGLADSAGTKVRKK
jgi:hypothetical protein